MAREAIGPGTAMLLVAGNLVGSGIYLLPASLAAIGTIAIWGWLVAAAGSLVVALMFAVAARRSGAGGLMDMLREAGGPRVALFAMCLYWMSVVIGNVGIALAVTGALGFFLPAATQQPAMAMVTTLVVWLLLGLAATGARRIAGFGASMMIVGLLPVILVATLGWLWFDPALFRAGWNMTGGSDLSAVLGSLGLVLWAFIGVESGAAVAARVASPARNVPLAIVGGLAIATAIYLAASAAIGGLLPAAVLARSGAPFADATVVMLGVAAGAVAAASAAGKASGTLGGWLLVAAESGARLGRPASAGPPAWGNFLFLALVSAALLAATAAPTIGAQFGLVINATVVLALLFYALTGLLLAWTGWAGPLGRLLGAASAALALAVVAIQPMQMLAIGLCALLLAALATWVLVRRG